MDFRVNWDSKVWITTVSLLCLLIAAIVLILAIDMHGWQWVLAVPFMAAIAYCVMKAPIKVRITSTGIELFKIFGKISFPYYRIREISLANIDSDMNLRIWGSGGFFGYTGLFFNKRIGRFRAYMGSIPRAVLIVLENDRKYVISCLQPDKFVEISRANMRRMNKNATP